jgi:hypothetical protein
VADVASVSLAALLEEATRRVAAEEARVARTALGPERVALIIVRDPDGGTTADLFIGGKEVEARVFTIDAAAGYDWEDWKAGRDSDLDLAAEMGLVVFHAVRDAYDDPPGGQEGIFDKPEEEPWV